MTPNSLRAALGDPDADFPRTALAWARDNAAQAAPVLLAMLKACAKPGDLTEREAVGGFYAAVLLSAQREPRGFPVVCALARNGDRLDELLQDFGIDYLHRLLVGLDGGDREALLAVVTDRHVEQMIRAAFLQAWTWHAVRDGEPACFARAAGLRAAFAANDGDLWHEWAQTLIALDAQQAGPLIEAACAHGEIDQSLADKEDYLADAAAWREDPVGCRETYLIENGPIGDPVAVLDHWLDSLDRAQNAEDREGGDDSVIDDAPANDADDPAENPFRTIGRNDPCPCGSGKKFKKCCLPKIGAGPT